MREKKIRGYVQYPNVIEAVKARTLDFYLPNLVSFPYLSSPDIKWAVNWQWASSGEWQSCMMTNKSTRRISQTSLISSGWFPPLWLPCPQPVFCSNLSFSCAMVVFYVLAFTQNSWISDKSFFPHLLCGSSFKSVYLVLSSTVNLHIFTLLK